MSQAFHAIYEHGILRPLTPLNLPESAEVAGVLQETTGGEKMLHASDPLLGSMSDDAELLDAIVEDVMVSRESHSFRLSRE